MSRREPPPAKPAYVYSEFPKMMYHPTLRHRTVYAENEQTEATRLGYATSRFPEAPTEPASTMSTADALTQQKAVFDAAWQTLQAKHDLVVKQFAELQVKYDALTDANSILLEELTTDKKTRKQNG